MLEEPENPIIDPIVNQLEIWMENVASDAVLYSILEEFVYRLRKYGAGEDS